MEQHGGRASIVPENRTRRSHWLRRVLLGTAAVWLSACGSSSGQAWHWTNLPAAAVRLSDLPRGMERSVPAAPVTLPMGAGARSTRTEYFHPASSGLTAVDNQIAAYLTPSAARQAYEVEVRRMSRATVLGSTSQGTISGDVSHGYPYHRSTVPATGDRATAYTADAYGDEFATTTRVMVFQRQHYLVFLRIVGLQHQVPLRTIEQLAGRIDRRLGR